MLILLEVQGFKNLLDMQVDFGPFTCIAGANGIGKSNVFDVIEFLSYLATDSLVESSQRVRGASGVRGGDPRDLFWDGYRDHQRRIKIAAEMIVPAEVEDDLGASARATTTFLRYELDLGYVAPEGEGSFGKPQPRAAARAGRTVLSTVTTNDYPTILAARREMQGWRRLALEPSALRAPDGLTDPRSLDVDGRHLASTLFRIAHDKDALTGRADPDAVYARVAGRLSDLTGVEVEGLAVELDQVREVFTLFLRERGGLRLPARALSEGTLRFLALCVLLEDPSFTGLICMEEPENGIHPANLPAMLELVRDLAVDPQEAPDDNNPLRQVIVNTHSPGVVQLCDPEDLLLADTKTYRTEEGEITRALSLLPYSRSWRTVPSSPVFTRADVTYYLAAPEGAQLQLPLDMVG